MIRPTQCTIPDCGKPYKARGLCNTHYRRWQRHGDPQADIAVASKRRSVRERLAEKFTVGAPDACGEWEGARDPKGYGRFRFEGRNQTASRTAWVLAYGPIPEEMFVCHHCDNPPCVNLSHLFLGTVADNAADMVQKNRSARGERSARSRLTTELVRRIRAEFSAGGISHTALARRYGIARPTVSDLLRRDTWAHI